MRKILGRAIKETLPVLFGYAFVGIAFGLMMQRAGYHFLWALLSSLLVYAGSMQFVLVSFLSGGIGLASIIVTTFAVNSRHIFYGISFIDKFRNMGKKRWYMIFSLTDETYSLLCSVKAEKEEQGKLYFLIALLNQIYWIVGSVVGALLGEVITFNTKGIDFAMTALFTVIFVEQWYGAKNHFPAVIGLLCAIASLLIFGPQNFLLPALLSSVVLLLVLRNKTKEEVL